MKFRIVLQSPWRPWDEELLREIRFNANSVFIWVPGLIKTARYKHRYVDQEDPRLLRWEECMHRIRIKGARTFPRAYIVMQFNNFPSWRDPMRPGRRFIIGERTFRRWHLADGLSKQLSMMLFELKSFLGDMDIYLHVEDWSARWAMLANFKPAAWLMDNPFLCRSECIDRWPHLLNAPGVLRRSELSLFWQWRFWKMHFRQDELIASHKPMCFVHGKWSRHHPGYDRRPEPLLKQIAEQM
jgi:hypothetical protein